MTNDTIKDPVCGMTVRAGESLTASYQGRTFHFCSDLCQRKFLADPEKYARAPVTLVAGQVDTVWRIAYFSMEVGVGSRMPTYNGGLGILAGDTVKSCADLKIPVVAVSLLYAQGYFDQKLDAWGAQHELPVAWDPARFLRLLPVTVQVRIERRPVVVRAWQYNIIGSTGYTVPLILLDTNVEENTLQDRELTSSLYGGDERYRLAQEVVFGTGGVRMLRALGYTQLQRFHMNEGHASLLTLELLRERDDQPTAEWDYNGVRSLCVFTTHTPAPAGHDQFSYDLVKSVVGEVVPLEVIQMLGGKERLKYVIPLTALIIFVLIYLNTNSIIETVIILLAVPFSLVGAFWLLYLLDYNLSVAVWVGISPSRPRRRDWRDHAAVPRSRVQAVTQ